MNLSQVADYKNSVNLPTVPTSSVPAPLASSVGQAVENSPVANPAKETPPAGLQVSDSLELGPSLQLDAEELRLASEKAAADYKILREIMERTLKSVPYPPLQTVERLAAMIGGNGLRMN